MIQNANEYEKAQEELRDLQTRLEVLQREHPIGEKGFTKAGIRKLISRLNEELAVFEGSSEAQYSNFGLNLFCWVPCDSTEDGSLRAIAPHWVISEDKRSS